jgi:hypothetical protein
VGGTEAAATGASSMEVSSGGGFGCHLGTESASSPKGAHVFVCLIAIFGIRCFSFPVHRGDYPCRKR